MKGKKAARLVVLLALVGGGAAYYLLRPRSSDMVLTGIVTTNDVIVSSQIGGQIDRLTVNEGDVVKRDQLIAVTTPEELKADLAYYSHSLEGLSSQVQQSEADLRYQEQQTENEIRQAEAMLASTLAQQAESTANLEIAHLNFERNENLQKQGVVSAQQLDEMRTSYDAARAHLDSLNRQVEAQRAALALAKSNAEQIAAKRSQLAMNQHQQAAASAQERKADVRLGYTEVRSPVDGIVDVRAARTGEVVSAGQPIVTLINPDDLWVRADVEETYIDRIRLGDRLTVRLPSGEERTGTVFYRGADAAFATQRDVSRTKRDIKTFEIRLRVDNSDRRLAVGMTAYVIAPFGP